MNTILDPDVAAQNLISGLPMRNNESASPPVGVQQMPSLGHVRLVKMLVPVDFTTATLKALAYARLLATPFGSTVCLLHVVERASFLAGTEAVLLWKSEQEVCGEAHAWLEELAQHGFGTEVAVEILVVSGIAGREIPRVARATGSGLVILTTHGLEPWPHWLRDSTAKCVMRAAPCPVLLLHCPKPKDLVRNLEWDIPEISHSSEAQRAAA